MRYVLIVAGQSQQVHSPKPPLHYEADGAGVDIDFGNGEPICTLTHDDPHASWWLVERGSRDYVPPGTESDHEMTVIAIDPATTTKASFFGHEKPCIHSTIRTRTSTVNLAGATGVVIGDGSSQTNVFN